MTCKPTILFGVFEYLSPALSRVIDPPGTYTKFPFKKYTPSFKLNTAFCPTGFVAAMEAPPEPPPTFTNGVPDASLCNTSPATKDLNVLPVPDPVYFK